MTSPLRDAARVVRHAPDRVAHPWRRRRALERAAELSPRRLLAICLGNICRSPYAEHRLGALLPDREVRSAGLLESGRRPPDLALIVGRERGIDLEAHRSIRLSDEWIAWADLVLVMNRSQAVAIGERGRALGLSPPVEWLGDFDPEPLVRRALRDPYGQEREVFEAVYARIDACCGSLAAALEGRS